MEVIKEFRNNLLKRIEVEVSKAYDKNPGLEKAKQDVAVKFKVLPERVYVKNVLSSFGSNNFVIDSFIYDSSDDMNKIQIKNKKKKRKAKNNL